jgi:hypothetical protein
VLVPSEPTLPRVVYTLPWVGYLYLVIFHPITRVVLAAAVGLLVLLVATEVRRRRERAGPPAGQSDELSDDGAEGGAEDGAEDGADDPAEDPVEGAARDAQSGPHGSHRPPRAAAARESPEGER